MCMNLEDVFIFYNKDKFLYKSDVMYWLVGNVYFIGLQVL